MWIDNLLASFFYEVYNKYSIIIQIIADRTDFFSACKQGNMELVKILLDERIDTVNDKSEYGNFM